MKKTTIVTAIAALALLVAPSAARADKSFTFKIGPPNTTGGATGFWIVTATRIGAGDADTSTSWKVDVVADSGVNKPTSGGGGTETFARQVAIQWTCCPALGTQKVLTAKAYVTPPGDVPAGEWSSAIAGNGADHDHLADTGGGGGLLFDGSNTFTAEHTLSQVANQMFIDVTDGPGVGAVNNWTGAIAFGPDCVPEPASMSLAFAGLAPLVGAMLKRRRRSSEDEGTEDTA